jgi:thiamine biosynthesis lipoprotein
MSSKAEFETRCRPALGSLVEIALTEPVWETGFAAIREVERVMSFHDEHSVLSRLNRAPIGEWVEVGEELSEVLALSLELQALSAGRFNVAIGRPLVHWKLLPGEETSAGWPDLEAPGFACRERHACRLAPVLIDLGGIAKGYAVDRAVEAIRAICPHAQGSVNAGGDLRAFGERQQAWIRAERSLTECQLSDEALASSSVRPSGEVSAYVSIPGRAALREPLTVYARAKSCVIADALTKIALCLPPGRAESVAGYFGAEVGWIG